MVHFFRVGTTKVFFFDVIEVEVLVQSVQEAGEINFVLVRVKILAPGTTKPPLVSDRTWNHRLNPLGAPSGPISEL